MQDANKSAQGAGSRAVLVLVCGVLSIFCLGFIAGLPAIFLGMGELKAIKAGQSPAAGEGITRAGCILGIVGTAISSLVFMFLASVLAMGASVGAASYLRSIIFP